MVVQSPTPLSAQDTVVIVGAGLAGVSAAKGLRDAGFGGRVILASDELHSPYDRPPLSKEVLKTSGHEARIGLWRPEDQDGIDVDLRLGLEVVAVDRPGRSVELSNGERIAYSRLVLATGSTPRTLDAFPRDGRRVHYLRGLDDAIGLREALQRARRVLIVGAGVIGLEVAASAAATDRSITIIEAGNQVMARGASPAIGEYVLRRHRQAGVDIRLNTTVEAIDDIPGRLVLSDGSVIDVDLILVAIGVVPNDALARAIGLEARPQGIVVDAFGRTSDPAIYAAGEVALHFNEALGRHDRQETWAHAAAHGEHVGRSLMGESGGYDHLASYWSDQYDYTLNVIGAASCEEEIVRGDPDAGQFLVIHVAAGLICGVSAINAPRELRAAKPLLGRPIEGFERARLADPSVSLKALAG